MIKLKQPKDALSCKENEQLHEIRFLSYPSLLMNFPPITIRMQKYYVHVVCII